MKETGRRKDERTPQEIFQEVVHDIELLRNYKTLYGVDVPQSIYDALQEQMERMRKR